MNRIAEISVDDLFARLEERADMSPRLIQAMVELTYGCNLRCVHCYNPTHEAKNELNTAAVKRVLRELAGEGCLRVGFTGGELFTRRDALEILQYARDLGLLLNILTNATMITPALADQISALNVFAVDVSMYGATAAAYESVTQVRGSFARFVTGLDLLIERRIPVLLKLVLLTPNVHEHEAMRDFAIARRLRYQVSTDVHPRVDGGLEPLAYRVDAALAFDVWRRESGEKLAQNLARDPGTRPCEPTADKAAQDRAGRVFHCNCGRKSAAVTPHGRLNLCLSICDPQYDLSRGTVKDGWRALVDLVRSMRPGPRYECDACALADHCSRGAGDSWLNDRVFDRECIPYYRELAERKATFSKCANPEGT
jgi:MoaA/NifB/PqqE/SkfB family radical SAM enzyme